MACPFPVTVNSDPQCILQAYMDSGYWNMIDASHQAAAKADPVGYLQNHPWLYTAFPTFFTQVSTSQASASPLQQAFQQLASGGTTPIATPPPSSTSVAYSTATASSGKTGISITGILSKYWLWIVVGIVAIIAIWLIMRRR